MDYQQKQVCTQKWIKVLSYFSTKNRTRLSVIANNGEVFCMVQRWSLLQTLRPEISIIGESMLQLCALSIYIRPYNIQQTSTANFQTTSCFLTRGHAWKTLTDPTFALIDWAWLRAILRQRQCEQALHRLIIALCSLPGLPTFALGLPQTPSPKLLDVEATYELQHWYGDVYKGEIKI